MKNVMAPYWTFWAVADMGHGWWLLLSFEGIAPALSTHHSVGNGWQTMLACRFCHRIFTLRSCINTRVHLKQIFCPTIPWQVSLCMQLLTNTKIVTVKIASLMRKMAWSTDHRWKSILGGVSNQWIGHSWFPTSCIEKWILLFMQNASWSNLNFSICGYFNAEQLCMQVNHQWLVLPGDPFLNCSNDHATLLTLQIIFHCLNQLQQWFLPALNVIQMFPLTYSK